MRRFDIPAAPPVAGGHGDFLRLVDPRGLAVAWLDPQAGRCVGYAARPAGVTVGGWRELLGGADRGAAGGTIAVGWPWPGETPPDTPMRWQLIERDPTAATCACRCVSRADSARVAELSLDAWLDEGMLRLRLTARVAGATATLRPRFLLALPEAGVALEPAPVNDPSEDARAPRRTDATLRLTAATGPRWHASWARETGASGTVAAASAAPLGASAGDERRCLLTVTVGPLD